MTPAPRRSRPRTCARGAALTLLEDVLLKGCSLAAVLPDRLTRVAAADRALVQALVYGVLRVLPRLEHRLDQLLNKPLRKRDSNVRLLLLLGLYQIDCLRTPNHAAVSETVRVADHIGKSWAKPLLNAALRRATREPAADPPAAVQHCHPQWLAARVEAAWPRQWHQILKANNTRAPMTLRVNSTMATRERYLLELESSGIAAAPCQHAPQGITLDKPVDVEQLPGFGRGMVSVQDESSQLAAHLLAVAPGQRVLDACAAPGGKTAHLLELQPSIQLTAIDVDERRLARLAQNLERLRLHANRQVANAMEPEHWWDGVPFDRILLDAPCSATGVIRRHPDIKWLRQHTDLEALAQTQARLLDAMWPLLTPGGLVLYATCSILPHENQSQVERFVQSREDAVERHIDASWGETTGPGRQILPGAENMDGFYYAVVEKR